MKAWELSRKSLHFWLATFYSKGYCSNEIDFCQYFWRVMFGVALLSVYTFLASVFTLSFGMFVIDSILGNIGAVPMFPNIFKIPGAIVCGIVFIICGVVIAVFALFLIKVAIDFVQDKFEILKGKLPEKIELPEVPSFLSLAYHKFKTKTCFKVTFK